MRILILPLLAGALVIGACSSQEDSQQVSFSKDLMPILETNCLECHSDPDAKGTKVSGVRLDSYDGIMAGTKFGPIVDPGYPASSVLNQVIEGRVDKSIAMPHDADQPLSETRQKLFRDWVAQGARNN